MAITINWGQKIINVPRADMLLIQSVPVEVRQLNLNDFRLTLNDLQDDEAGIPFPTTHRHVAPISVGGVTLERVVEIINGYTVTFEDGQYAVNLVGANSNVGDVVNVNQVSVRSANSAGLVNLDTLLGAAYQNEVCVDFINGQPGTATPLGTRGTPVNNLDDALAIAEGNSIATIQFLTPGTIANTNFAAGYNFRADSELIDIVVDPSANVTNCTFENMSITGTLDGGNTFRGCIVEDINYVNGTLFQCALRGTISLGGNSQADILDCWSQVAGGGPGQLVALDLGGSGNSLTVRNFAGGLNLQNFSGGGAVSIDMNSGRVEVEPTVTAGEITIRGVADVTDNSSGTAVVDDLTVNVAVDEGFATVDQISAILSNIEGGYDADGILRLILAAVAGKGGDADADDTYRFRDIADTKDRIVAVTDGAGNRTSVTLDGT